MIAEKAEEPTQREKEEAERARRAMLERFQTASFSELCEMSAASRPAHTETLYQCLSDIYSKSTWNASVGSSSRKSSIASCSYDTTDVHKTETKLQLRHHGCPQD